MTQPWEWSALTAVEKLLARKISSLELLENLRGRIASVDTTINALPTLCFERAKDAAGALERQPPKHRGVFSGLPVPIKDSAAVQGVRTTYGSLAFADHIPAQSSYVVDAIEAEGGIVYAKSNTPEFEAGANTFNEVFGRTLNPWNVSRSAGGSSGGAAAAVASGMAFVAQGSDFACSLRYPAAFCGVVGLRPSPGVIPQGPSSLPGQVLSVMGPVARTVADVGLALDGMACFDARDPLTRPHQAGAFVYTSAAQRPKRPERVAFSMTLGMAVVEAAVRARVGEALDTLASAGLRIERADPRLPEADQSFRSLRAFQFAALHAETLHLHREKLKPDVVWNIEQGLKLSATDLIRAEDGRAQCRREILTFLDTHGILVTPTAPVEPFPVEQRFVDQIDGRKLDTYLDWLVLGYAISVCGCPAISIPCGLSKNGLPIGLQLVAKPYCEAELLQAAAWFESVLDCSLSKPIDPVASIC